MQLIEKNSFNVRAVVYRLKKDGSDLEFLIFPMIHVGSTEFYDEVSRRLASCDLILAEGVKSRRVNLLTLSYRIVKHIRRMDLVTQRDAMRMEGFGAKILKTDMHGAAFDERWSSLPLSLRAQLLVLMPIYVVYLFLFGTRETLAESIALDDLPSSDEILSEHEDFEPLNTLIVEERDRILLEHVTRLEDAQNGARQIGIVYGAHHMRTTMRFLMQEMDYRIAKAEWVKVFDL